MLMLLNAKNENDENNNNVDGEDVDDDEDDWQDVHDRGDGEEAEDITRRDPYAYIWCLMYGTICKCRQRGATTTTAIKMRHESCGPKGPACQRVACLRFDSNL